MTQDATLCLTTTDDALQGVLGLLPPGPAWEAAHVPGTTHNSFWRAIAGAVAYINTRLCAFTDELFCSTAVETQDQWNAEYNYTSDDGCAAYASLCAKVNAYGGQSAQYIIDIAASLGWSITITDNASALAASIPRLGFATCGCIALAPASTSAKTIANTYVGNAVAGCVTLGPHFSGESAISTCLPACGYGPISNYPDPSYFPQGTDRTNAPCLIGGSKLGTAQCCNYAGYFEIDTRLPDALTSPSNGCSTSNVYTFTPPTPSTVGVSTDCLLDSTGNFLRYDPYGAAFTVTIDVAASQAAQALGLQNITTCGCMQVGLTMLRGKTYTDAQCFIEAIKPAHTTVTYVYTNIP